MYLFIKKWFLITRFPSVMLALSSILMGTALSIWVGSYNVWISILAAITAILLQIISNLANDHGDFIRGGEVGTRVDNTLNTNMQEGVRLSKLKTVIIRLTLLTAVCGFTLLYIANLTQTNFMLFASLGVIAIIAAITYTMGPKPYAYSGLGDISVFVFFGFVGVIGTAYLQTQIWRIAYLLPAITCGCFSTAILNLNNIRDIVADKIIHKKTLAVRIGRKFALCYQWLLLILGIMCTIIFTIQNYKSPLQFLFLGTVPILFQNGILTTKLSASQLDPLLPRLVGTQLVFVLLFMLGIGLS